MAAPSADSVLFPPLDKCLSGEQQLLSWKDAFIALSSSNRGRESAFLERFLTHQTNVATLSKPYEPFQAPSAQSKSAFETKTAAINVPSSEDGQYDISQIKEDALWLSKEAKVDEVSALRIALLEWQTRPAAQLLSGFTEEEALSVQSAAGGANLGSSTFLPNSSILAAATDGLGQNFAAFASAEQRRLRILDTYLSERTHILKLSDLLVRIGSAALKTETSAETRDKGTSKVPWVAELGKSVFQAQCTAAAFKSSFDALRARFQALAEGSGWYQAEGGNSDAEEIWGHCQLTEAISLLQIIFAQADTKPEALEAQTLIDWFDMTASYDFFKCVQLPFLSQQELLPSIQVLVSIVCLTLLDLDAVLARILGEADVASATYITDEECVRKLTELFIATGNQGPSPASPAVFAWTIIALAAKNNLNGIVAARDNPAALVSGEPSMAEKVVDTISDIQFDEDPFVFLATASVDGAHIFDLIAELSSILTSNFDGRLGYGYGEKSVNIDLDCRLEASMRLRLLNLIRDGSFAVEYSPEVILGTLAVLKGGQTYWDFTEQDSRRTEDPVMKAFLEGSETNILGQAEVRFPYETLPLLQFYKAVCFGSQADEEGNLVIAQKLLSRTQFTQVLPPRFAGYTTIREEENAFSVQLLEDLSLFSSRKGSRRPAPRQAIGNELVLADESEPSEEHIIPAGTIGYVLNPDVKPHVVAWSHKHSALRYLSVSLLSILSGSDLVETAQQKTMSIDDASEFIGLLAMLVTASVRVAKANDLEPTFGAQRILEDASDGLNRNQDIVSLVFDIFEQELQRLRERPNNASSLSLLVNCLYFIHALVAVLPNRIWPFFARSRLLDIDGIGGSLIAVVSGTEMVTGRYDLLIGCVRLFEALAEDSVKHSVSNKLGTKAVARFSAANSMGGGSPEKIMSKVLLSFAKTFVGVFESCPSWRFNLVEQKMVLNSKITSIFDSILRTVYGFDDEGEKPSDKLCGVLAPTAEYLLDVFHSVTAHDIPTHALLNIFYSGTKPPPSSTPARLTQLWTSQTTAAVAWATTVLRAGVLLNRPASHIEKQLFKASPLLARLSIAHETFKSPVMRLLEALVKSAARGEAEPPSLLGHLGPETAKSFLSVMSSMSGPLKDTQVEVDIWRLLSTVVSNKQQWFSIYLLTGSTPRDSLRTTNKQAAGRPRGRPLLTSALDQLCDINSLEARRAVAMLEFISLAQNHWPWAVTSMHRHQTFLSSIMEFIKNIQPSPANASIDTVVADCVKIHMASLIADIGAMCLHAARQLSDIRPVQHVIHKLGYLTSHGVEVPPYNQSLHTNLKKNLERKFPGCKLSNFKKTLLTKTDFGRNYFYDLDYASEVLGFDVTWAGNKNQGFANEFERANVNLSLVEAKIMLLKSWKLLAIELGSIINKDHRIEEILSPVVEDCLKSNQQSSGSQALFGRLVHVRADFAFVLMQKLVQAECKSSHVRSLFRVAWDTIRLSGQDFEIAFVGENADYYRTLLRILFLTLQPHLGGTAPSEVPKSPGKGLQRATPTMSSELLEILKEVVAKGLRSLANQLHEDQESVSPSDFVLLSAILQTILRIPGMHTINSQVALLFANNNTSRYAVSLFTWADQLTIDGDPVYGELSILFLLELSSILPMAETLAVEGVLSRLSTANLMNHYRKPKGMGPFDEPARLFSLWSRGILPLCLNLLEAVGSPVAAEVATFLNQFPTQLARASAALNASAKPSPAHPNAGTVTLGAASEAHSLALIAMVLDHFRTDPAAATMGEIPALAWDRAAVKDDVETWLQGRKSLRERVVPLTERELELVKARAVGGAGLGAGVAAAENRLEERVVLELMGALDCLNAPGAGGSAA
ncbi:uncharacterized protein K452DRAFT_49192 [Aplosporella prunicola CBS 121167]|uniref:Nucleoporin NUP188 n=1 Tax=Aplosporella prunicola CBS 121167 TaxID=1176127 RepID=A0A6A6BAL1_9PEZI|nr:uncharacterized protein K452DRAFT_49192 [Aplosporella prunicola CBS 121167]KAF2140628.1 hypothetical protein K452DRAFT_49192 [Aplosporella prunicola CBS 121167]